MPAHESAAKRCNPLVLLLLVAACALGALAAPALALAQTYTVNSTGDQADETVGAEGCKTSADTCTLRAAIEEANAAPEADTIAFDPGVFEGQAADTISLGSELPKIVEPVTIDGDSCATAPCVGVTGGGTPLTVEAANVTLEGIAFAPTSTYTGGALKVLPGSSHFKAIDDWFGTTLGGTYQAFFTGIEIDSAGITAASEGAEIDNDNIATFAIGVSLEGPGAVIKQSIVYAGTIGMLTSGDDGGIGSRIEGSSVRGNVEAGIALQNDDNKVLGDKVINADGFGGIVSEAYLASPTGNVIGGDLTSEENVITTSSTDAIVIKSDEAAQNEIGRNRGSAGGSFISLVATGSGESGPNGGVQPPPIAAAFQSSARGTGAEPGAKILVFAKETEAAGEIASFLGMATADSSGNWRVVYSAAKVTAGSLVTATQTNVLGGTSELTPITTVATDPACPAADAVDCESRPEEHSSTTTTTSTSTGPAALTSTPAVAPQTKIAKGPKARSSATTAKFKFTSSVAGSTFQCKLDKKKYEKCASPKTYKKLKPGKHTFMVRAVGPTGLVDKTPAKRTFTLLG